MKKCFFAFIAILFLYAANVQAAARPSYYSVLHYFINNYDPELDKYASLSFAKKPDGWYVQVLDYDAMAADPTKSYSGEYLFWSQAKERYLPLKAFPNGQAAKEQIAKFWQNGLGVWYDMNRNLYYGYNGWDIDVIRALEGKANLNDTLRESLARAYGSYTHRFLWYQAGGAPIGDDPLQRKRDILAPVPEAAADSAVRYIRKSIEQYQLIAAHNPWYPTLVGAATTKVNNQRLFGWQLMMVSGYPDKAAPFFREIQFDSSQIRIAKALLDECSPNAILITYGDNDSYQLWYVQQAFGHRKDVSVVNISLLGMPEYIDWLKQSDTVAFSLNRGSYARKGFYYVRVSPSDDTRTPGRLVVKSIPEMLSNIAAAPDGTDFATVPYTADSLIIPVNPRTTFWKSWPFKPLSAISPAMKSYYMLSDLLLMDLVNSNISSRPIYFSSQEDGLFLPYQLDYGMSHQLIPAKMHLASDTLSISRMNRVVAHQDDFIPTYSGADNQARGALIRLLNIHLALGGYYNEKGDTTKKKKYLNGATKLVQQHSEVVGEGMLYTGHYLIKYGHDKKQGQAFINEYLKKFVANSQHYSNALWPPQDDDGDEYYRIAYDLYKEEKLPTSDLETIWAGRRMK